MSQYKIKSSRIKGHAMFTFKNGELKKFEMYFKAKLTEVQAEAFRSKLPIAEAELPKLSEIGFEVEKYERANLQFLGEKVALFCKMYNARHRQTYKARKNEVGLLSQVPVTSELVAAYLKSDEWWSKPKSIGNYVSRINEINLLLATGDKPKSKFPNEWSVEAERKYEGGELVAFWQHLREIGLKPVKHEVTKKTIRWE